MPVLRGNELRAIEEPRTNEIRGKKVGTVEGRLEENWRQQGKELRRRQIDFPDGTRRRQRSTARALEQPAPT